jgi:hypothetical protein
MILSAQPASIKAAQTATPILRILVISCRAASGAGLSDNHGAKASHLTGKRRVRHSGGWLHRSEAARSHHAAITVAYMRIPFACSMYRTFRPQAGFL